MRRLITILLTTFLVSTLYSQTDILTESESKAVVTNFMISMKNILFEKKDILEKYIDPLELQRHKLNDKFQGINTYAIGDFKITKTDLPYVTVQIKFPQTYDENNKHQKNVWTRELTFKVNLRDGQTYLIPTGPTTDLYYINPWWTDKPLK